MRVAVGSDEDAPMVRSVIDHLRSAGHEVDIVGLDARWPDVGRAVAEAVTVGCSDFGIVCCWTGTGVSIAANKVVGARAALCGDAQTASGARRWNDANVLALSIRATTPAVAAEITDAFLSGAPDPSEGDAVDSLER